MAKAAKGPVDELQREISAILRERIARRHLVQGAVAKAADISPSQLSDILGDKKHIDIGQLDRLCFALDFPLLKLIGQAEEATASRHAEKTARAVRAV